MGEENRLIVKVVEHTDVAWERASSITRKNHEQPKSNSDERKHVRNHYLTNAPQVVNASFRRAFARSIANRHESDAPCEDWRLATRQPCSESLAVICECRTSIASLTERLG